MGNIKQILYLTRFIHNLVAFQAIFLWKYSVFKNALWTKSYETKWKSEVSSTLHRYRHLPPNAWPKTYCLMVQLFKRLIRWAYGPVRLLPIKFLLTTLWEVIWSRKLAGYDWGIQWRPVINNFCGAFRKTKKQKIISNRHQIQYYKKGVSIPQ